MGARAQPMPRRLLTTTAAAAAAVVFLLAWRGTRHGVRADVCCLLGTSGDTCLDAVDFATCQQTLGGYYRVTDDVCTLATAAGVCNECVPCEAQSSGAPACNADFTCGEHAPFNLMSCAEQYNRCFVQAVARRGASASPDVYVCGGEQRVDLPCAVDIDEYTCAVGRCELDSEFAATGQTVCTNLRRFPCACQCASSSPPSSVACGTLSAYVFEDVNQNNVPDVGEARGVNTVVGLWRSVYVPTQPPLRVTQTDATGFFSFTSLEADTYYSTIVALSPEQSGVYTPISGDNAVSIDAVTCSSSSSSFTETGSSRDSADSHATLAPSDVANLDMGRRHGRGRTRATSTTISSQTTTTTMSTNLFITTPKYVSGRVLYDANGNNIDDGVGAGEYGIGGAVVRAYLRPSLTLQGVVVTSAEDDGIFLFTSLPTGRYDFVEQDAAAFNVSTGDSQGSNDNRILDVQVSSSFNVTTLRFFDAPTLSSPTLSPPPPPLPPTPASTTDTESPATPSECDSLLTWWLSIECLEYTYKNHILAFIVTLLLLACCCCFFVTSSMACISVLTRVRVQSFYAKRWQDSDEEESDDAEERRTRSIVKPQPVKAAAASASVRRRKQ